MKPACGKPARIVRQTPGGKFQDANGKWWTLGAFGWVQVEPVEVRS